MGPRCFDEFKLGDFRHMRTYENFLKYFEGWYFIVKQSFVFAFRHGAQQHFRCQVLQVSAMKNVKLQFWQSQKPTRQFSGSFGCDRDPSKRFTVYLDQAACFLQVLSPRCDGPYNFTVLLLRSCRLLLLVVECARLVANWAATSVFLLL